MDTSTPNQMLTSSGLMILRIAAGMVFIAHGAQKIFEFTIPGTIRAFAGFGVPLPSVVAPMVAVLELLGGALLIIGLCTRIIGALLTVDMVGAVVFVRLAGGFWVDKGGYEFVALLGVVALALALTGAGLLSLDHLLWRGRLRLMA